MRLHRALSLECGLRRDEILTRLQASSTFGWRDDGDELSAEVDDPPLAARLRLRPDHDDEWTLDVEAVGPSWATRALYTRAHDKVVAAIGAELARETRTLEVTTPLAAPPPREVHAASTFVDYLCTASARGRAHDLATILDGNGGVDAELFLAWCGGRDGHAYEGWPFGENRVVLGPTAPIASVGDLWFDVCELALMLRLERAWFALHAVPRWKVDALNTITGRDAPMSEGPLAPAVVSHERAAEYARFFGKTLPDRAMYEQAEEAICTPSLKGFARPEFADDEWTRDGAREGARSFRTAVAPGAMPEGGLARERFVRAW